MLCSQVHLMAEARGLMHESVGEGGARRLVVWKPSRSRRQATDFDEF